MEYINVILIQTYQELYYALKVLQMLTEIDQPLYEKLHEQIAGQIEKLVWNIEYPLKSISWSFLVKMFNWHHR